jgi:hypothetical protein
MISVEHSVEHIHLAYLQRLLRRIGKCISA